VLASALSLSCEVSEGGEEKQKREQEIRAEQPTNQKLAQTSISNKLNHMPGTPSAEAHAGQL
jgi:hypothetical protein